MQYSLSRNIKLISTYFKLKNTLLQLCNNYINHIKKIIPDVVAADGKSTSH